MHGLSIRFREISLETGEQRFRLLIQEIFKSEKEVKVIVPEYLKKYKHGLFSVRETIPQYAKVVQKMIKKDYDNETFILVGYSIGGLIVRYVVEKMGLPVKAVILIGTPNKGIKLRWWEKLLQGIIRTPCVEDMKRPSKFLCDILKVSPKNYYHIIGTLDTRVPLNSSIPELAEYMKNGGRSGRVFALPCTHSRLIPKSKEYIENSAIPEIIKIIRKEIEK